MQVSASSPKAQLRDQLRETVKTAILEAAEELIAENGLASAPLLQIAKRAGVAVGTLYNYFADRDALIAALFDMRRGTLRPAMRAAVTAGVGLPFEARLKAFVRDLFTAFEAHRKFLKVAIETEHLKIAAHSTPNDLTTAVADLMKIGIKERVVDEARADLLPVAMVGAIKGFVLRKISNNAKLDASDADRLVDLFLDGVRA